MKRVRIFIAVLCVCVMAVCSYMLYMDKMEDKRGANAYEALRGVVEMPESDTGRDPALYPEVNFESLEEIKINAIAWIHSPGTPVDYPIMQAKDNDYYLHRMPDGSYNRNGSIFLDFRCSSDFSDKNSVVYGHHMKNEAMFSTLERYKTQSYYEEHPVMYLIKEMDVYRVELFAGDVRKAQHVRREFKDDDEFLAYVNALKEHSTFRSDVEVEASDRLITFFTCVYDFEDSRYVLTGKLVPLTNNNKPSNEEEPLNEDASSNAEELLSEEEMPNEEEQPDKEGP